ncbi:hypothetical protein GUJ93_ZPchr0009g1482 [Zizania palustris]|uniref:Uncharacterized protein n=1 Tax=Zizania palustris TaxID=103762 RepID=A0A8J5UY20_ZIZPA|nr:hypothetical protein GUJ93_ZPchr0009g1482 [Zizania palustris]
MSASFDAYAAKTRRDENLVEFSLHPSPGAKNSPTHPPIFPPRQVHWRRKAPILPPDLRSRRPRITRFGRRFGPDLANSAASSATFAGDDHYIIQNPNLVLLQL